MIALKDVTKRYGRKGAGTDALHDVSVDLTPGTVWAVVGPNGAGKSTLLSLLLGFIRPSEGRVSIAGESPRDYLRDSGAGYLPERFSVPGGWRAGEALRMYARLEGVDEEAVTAAVDLMGLGDHLAKRADELSRGLLQRLGLAQALLARRQLIVLDEPTEGLDPVWRVRLRDIITDLRADDRTIVVASHDLAELERSADRALVLERGSLREIIDVRDSGDDELYRLRLAAPFGDVHGAFPGAEARGDLQYDVRVAGPGELSQRLAGLIALGAVIAAVEPLRPDLEQRVRAALDGDA